MTFIEGDAFEVIEAHKNEKQTVVFADPPYTGGGKRAGRRLYDFNAIDHEKLFRLASEASAHFIMTYDETSAVRQLGQAYDLRISRLPMKSTHHAKMTELAITN